MLLMYLIQLVISCLSSAQNFYVKLTIRGDLLEHVSLKLHVCYAFRFLFVCCFFFCMCNILLMDLGVSGFH